VPPRDPRNSVRREDGTASVELIAVAPFLLLAVLAAAQFALAGQALWSAGLAARAGARAAMVGGSAGAVARRALPPALLPGAKVDRDGGFSVSVEVPRLVPALPRLRVEARTDLGNG
jgi:hypothetical protein